MLGIKEGPDMPEYVCVVAKVHKRLYGQPQDSAPVCCGKPMELAQNPAQPMAAVQPAADAAQPQESGPRGLPALPGAEKNWWELWR